MAPQLPDGRIRDGLLRALPLIPVVGMFGVSFGVLADTTAGMGALAVVMSASTFAGSAQFAAISILGAGGQHAAAIVAAILLNLRYGPIGASVAPYLSGGVLRRFLVGQLIVDESWAVSARSGGFDRRMLIGAGLALWAAWVGGTAIGLVGGEALGDPEALGLDAAFPALFLALLVPQLASRRAVAAALLGGGVALALFPWTPPGVPIIAASLAALIGWSRTR